MNKKGAEMSLNVIIIAILVIIVLVVVVIVFSTKFSIFGKTTANCQSQGGQCVENNGTVLLPKCSEGYTLAPGAKCNASNEICCIQVSS
jgi:hypothetical protein